MDTIQITQAIRELRQMTVGELREKYIEVFGEANRSRNRDYLIRRIAWRIQATAEGGITERAKLRAQELANEADIRVRHTRIQPATGPAAHQITASIKPGRDPRLPLPGTILTREFQGRTICVEVGIHTFRWEDREYRTLSAIAKEVTGTQWNGFAFFGLGGGK
jgi:hypothetical protein